MSTDSLNAMQSQEPVPPTAGRKKQSRSSTPFNPILDVNPRLLPEYLGIQEYPFTQDHILSRNTRTLVWEPRAELDEHALQDVQEALKTLQESSTSIGWLEKNRLRLNMSRTEKSAKRKAYRREYSTRPDVILKRQEQANDPARIARIRALRADPERKKRKNERLKLDRAIYRKLKETKPQILAALEAQVSAS